MESRDDAISSFRPNVLVFRLVLSSGSLQALISRSRLPSRGFCLFQASALTEEASLKHRISPEGQS